MSDRYQRGLVTLEEVNQEPGTPIVDKNNQILPDLGKLTIEFAYGDIMSRPGLDLKAREIINVAALTVLGHTMPQLKVHIKGALNVGWTQTELKEAILQMAVYAGFPRMLNAMFVAQDIFEQRENKQED